MEALSVEEKAKAYDETIEKLRNFYRDYDTISRLINVKEELANLFPKLKESEDEKTKRILHSISSKISFHLCDIFTEEEFQCFDAWSNAWLEKQGSQILANSCKTCKDEQKPTDKVEPKFHKGDWVVVDDGRIGRIVECTKDFVFTDLEFSCLSIRTREDKIRPWTIQDAKDGDVIYSRHNTESFEWIGIFKSLDKENKRVFFYGFWHDMAKTFRVCGNKAYVLYDDFSPATKEQRDLLFQKMHEAGYEWDAAKKELKKIEQSPIDVRTTGYWHVEDVEQKLVKTEKGVKGNEREIPNSAWTEEDERIYKVVLELIDSYSKGTIGGCIIPPNIGRYLKWFKALKNRVQPKQEWSEEDEEYCQFLIKNIENSDPLPTSIYSDCKNWLKHLRERYTWKPSDEQIECLGYTIEKAEKDWSPLTNNRIYLTLKALKEQLLELRGSKV